MIDLAKTLTNKTDWVIFDTETTGLGDEAEVCQIGLLAPDGTVVMDQLVKPVNPIPASATRIHGIDNAMVQDAPFIWEIEKPLRKAMEGKLIVVYNAPYDSKVLLQSFTRTWPAPDWVKHLDYVDVMLPYADYYGDWNEYHGNNKWQSLTNACKQQGIAVEDAHNAVGDCKMTLALILKIAAGR